MEIQVAELDVDDADQRAATAKLIANAMVQSTTWGYVVGADRPDDLAWILERSLILRRGCTVVARDSEDGAIVATVTCVPPGAMEASTYAKLRAGMLWMPLVLGYAPMRRLLRMGRFHEVMQRPYADCYYIHMMAVRTDRQGRGLGSRLLAAVLAERVPPAAAVYLTTNSEANARFYARAGFASLGPSVRMESDEEDPRYPSYDVYEMRRGAAATAAAEGGGPR